MTGSSPISPGYGGQLWLNRAASGDDQQWPGAPTSTFSMNGHLGQYVIVSRDNGVTVVRLGKTQDTMRRPVHEALARIITLFPKGSIT
jgi:CubicO group peptidase (beta-lactamase class C family)